MRLVELMELCFLLADRHVQQSVDESAFSRCLRSFTVPQGRTPDRILGSERGRTSDILYVRESGWSVSR